MTPRRCSLGTAVGLACLLAGLVAAAVLIRPWQVDGARIAGAHQLAALLDGLGYRIDAVHRDEAAVPRVLLLRLPHDMAALAPEPERKRTFLRVMLPLVLAANDEVLADRRAVVVAREVLSSGGALSLGALGRLAALADRYRIDAVALEPEALVDALLVRVDAVPPSLALAQAVVESGWGTSRFAREGNALFGQASWSEDAMAPLGHEEPPFRIAAFATLGDSVAAYVANLNSHPAYATFRRQRAEQRAAGQMPDGRALAGTLVAYAETGQVYIDTLRSVIDDNWLQRLDRTGLDGGRTLIVMAAR